MSQQKKVYTSEIPEGAIRLPEGMLCNGKNYYSFPREASDPNQYDWEAQERRAQLAARRTDQTDPRFARLLEIACKLEGKVDLRSGVDPKNAEACSLRRELGKELHCGGQEDRDQTVNCLRNFAFYAKDAGQFNDRLAVALLADPTPQNRVLSAAKMRAFFAAFVALDWVGPRDASKGNFLRVVTVLGRNQPEGWDEMRRNLIKSVPPGWQFEALKRLGMIQMVGGAR